MPLVGSERNARESLVRAPGLVFGVAEVFQEAVRAARFPRDANLPAKVNHAMGKVDPGGLWDQLHHVLLNPFRRCRVRQFQPLRDAHYVRIDHHSQRNFVP